MLIFIKPKKIIFYVNSIMVLIEPITHFHVKRSDFENT